ncbi:DUF3993 domain-containing protein [Neobacillus sp. PS3-40]|uniref:DUF3993 domain-containing protein n=1 Tax=Neobacillus sp. PS3-40 TaxID=3070679 RepID=UPI0027E16FD0|nr:DUF3993 domain-containing protein [Neobacillus sp. PS3-40]WML43533.1 DUF3993 domain-containing protein [Neobacillus sp. PS3-40]
MKKKIALLFMLLFAIIPLSPQATSGLDTRNEVFDFLKGAYKAQVSLSEKGRSTEEIKKVLDSFFTDEYQNHFWKENIHKESGKFLTYGTDFAQYYIPYYQFSDETKVVILPKEIYVFEFFPENTNGPVGFKSHYEGLYIKRIGDNWKVDKYLYNKIPTDVIKKANISEKVRGKSDRYKVN